MQFRLVSKYDFNCLSFSVSTDRSDKTVFDSLVGFAQTLAVFRNVLKTTSFGYAKLTHSLKESAVFVYEHSDHETATHAVTVEVTNTKTGESETFYVEYK